MLPVHLQPESHVPLYVQLRDQLRALVHAGDLRPGDRIPASRELATMLGVHRTTVANAYAELESEGLIQGHVGRGTFIRGNGNGRKITPPAPAVLNGHNGIRWELLFADERGDETLSRLTAAAPEDALSFVMARPADEFFPVDELINCVNTVLRREAGESLDDDAALLLMARRILAGRGGATEPSSPVLSGSRGGGRDDGRASYQIAVTLCEACQRAAQVGGGEAVHKPSALKRR